MAVDIVDHSVGKIPSVGGSILVSESEDMVHGVGVGLAIANSVHGCMVHVKRMLGCGSPGIVYGELAVWGKGIYRQVWLGVACGYVVRELNRGRLGECHNCAGQ